MTNLLKKAFLLAGILCAQGIAAQTKADGIVAMQLEQWDKAITIYSSLVKADSTDQDAMLTLGNAYLAKGDQAKAEKIFEAAFYAKPEGALAFVALGRQGLLRNNVEEAEKQFKRAQRAGKKDIVALRQLGESYLFFIPPGNKRPNLTRAEALLKEAVDFNSKDYNTLMALAYCYKEMPNGGLAAQNYEFAAGVSPKDPLPKLMLARVYKAARVPDKPLAYFNEAIALKPDFSPALRGKAEYLYYGRKWEDATKAYKDLVDHGSEVTIEDEMQLANCLYITHDCVGVSALVTKILAKDGSKNYLRRLLAYCDYENGNYARGLETLNEYFKVVTPDKILPSDYEYLGNLLVKTRGDTLKAIDNYLKAIKMDTSGSRWNLYREIAELHYVQKDLCGAADAFKMYIDSLPESDPNYATFLYKLGISQYYCKSDSLRYQKSEATFAKITVMRPTAAVGWYRAALSAEAQDPTPDEIAADPTLAQQYGKARTYYEKYVELAGGDDAEKNKKELLRGYNYLAYTYFVKKEEAPFRSITEKWKALETDPDKLKTIQDMVDAFGKEDQSGTPGTLKPQAPAGNGDDKH